MNLDLRKLGSFMLLLVIPCLILTGCDKKTSSNQPGSGKASKLDSSVQILHRVHSESFRDENDGTVLLEAKITVPELANPTNDKAINSINQYYQTQIDSFMKGVREEDLKLAQEIKDNPPGNGYVFRSHCYESSFEIAYNGNNLLSILNTRFQNSGGAHPSYTRSSETFDLTTGKQLSLTEILGLDHKQALEKVYATATSQIKASEGTDKFFYFEDYPESLRQYYSADDFVLRENGLVFYYQLYSIAPYAAGFPEFELPYEWLGDTAMKIAPLLANQQEKDLYAAADQLLNRNREAFFDIFGLSTLAAEFPENGIGEDTILPVKDNRFASFSDLQSFVMNTYVKKEADFLLSEYRDGLYYDRNGRLYVDISKDAGMGYYVNWSKYRYEITDIKAGSAVLKIYTTDDSPAGTKEITLTAKLLKENGNWLLEKMIH